MVTDKKEQGSREEGGVRIEAETGLFSCQGCWQLPEAERKMEWVSPGLRREPGCLAPAPTGGAFLCHATRVLANPGKWLLGFLLLLPISVVPALNTPIHPSPQLPSHPSLLLFNVRILPSSQTLKKKPPVTWPLECWYKPLHMAMNSGYIKETLQYFCSSSYSFTHWLICQFDKHNLSLVLFINKSILTA